MPKDKRTPSGRRIGIFNDAAGSAPPGAIVIADFASAGAEPLALMGWSEHYTAQLTPEDMGLAPVRIATVHRARMSAVGLAGPLKLMLPPKTNTQNYAVGDWVLIEPETAMLVRRLKPLTLVQRRHDSGRGHVQLIAANIDTMFIVTSCNADFNPARLERYLALANEAGTTPVIVLTKADTTEDLARYRAEAEALQRDLPVVSVNAREAAAAGVLAPWCGPGQTVALIGSSGVGKSTLLNTLAGPDYAAPQLTGDIREADAKGRHTTTGRSLHGIAGGGWVIDTPGMRTLHLSDVGDGIDTLFAEITELAPECRFRDCTHAHEPGCAVQAAARDGRLDPERLARWRKLQDENQFNTPVVGRGNRPGPARGRR